MELPQVDDGLLNRFLVELLKVPSPTGYTQEAAALLQRVFRSISDVIVKVMPKGGLMVTLPGDSDDAPRALTAHMDTLGAMVKTIKANGRLTLSPIGNFSWNTVEGEGCTVFTRRGKRIRGSILIDSPSVHVHGAKVNETKREQEHMELRLDKRAGNSEEIKALGVSVGDFVAFDPRVELNNGFIRSRHLDDKAGVACLVEAIRCLTSENRKPKQTACFYFNNFEEVGHFSQADFPLKISELLVVDMAAEGEGQNSDEYHTTLCVKDSSGPYHQGMCERLRSLAEAQHIDYRVDIYPYYGSDGSAYWRSGGSVPVALIGPGVDASHNYERTHIDALVDTTRWVLAYLLS
jgi:putative aminopeptidase FrvX